MNNWIERLGNHRIAANGLMFLVILVGLFSLQKLNRQFFPDFEFNSLRVSASWQGASAEDIQEGLGIPLERAILTLTEVSSVRTTSSENRVSIRMDINEGIDADKAKQAVEDAIATVALPSDVDLPLVSRPVRYEPITELLIYGDVDISLLYETAKNSADELIANGIAQVSITGDPEERYEIVISAEQLLNLDMTLDQVAQTLSGSNQNLPAGIAGNTDVITQLRANGKAENQHDLESLPIIIDSSTGAEVQVQDVAQVIKSFSNEFSYLTFEGHPSVKISLRRQVGQDTLNTADIYLNWLESKEFPEGIAVKAYSEQWQFLESRIKLILDNGMLGMILVLIVLFIFLNTRIAIWVALGIPVSFMATFIFMDFSETTINAFSLFGFMIALGIIVDDAIVVSEDTEVLEAQGYTAIEASILAAKRMWPPVLASSLTTIAAFSPLLMLGGRLGDLLIDIPTVVVCAIIASLIECFLILPGHLAHNTRTIKKAKQSKIRNAIDDGFERFKTNVFRPLAIRAIDYRWITLSLVMAAFILMLGLVKGGAIKITLPPHVEGTSMSVSVQFAEGTEELIVNDFLNQMVNELKLVEKETGYLFIKNIILTHRNGSAENGSIHVEMVGDTDRPYTNQELVSQWRKKVRIPAGVETISFGRSFRGLSSADVVVRLRSDNPDQLKAASVALQAEIESLSGVSDIKDDLPYGTEQMRFTLTSYAKSLGFSLSDLASRTQSMLDGKTVSFIQENGHDLDVILRLPEAQASSIGMLESLPIHLSGDNWAPLGSLIEIKSQRGVDSLTRQDGEMSVIVTADIDEDIANTIEINKIIDDQIVPKIAAEYGVRSVIEGQRLDERKILSDMGYGVILASLLIFGILAWVFESWIWPLAVMIAIPFGLTGALFGHWVMGVDVSLLSLFGLFGLSGIVINDSIVLITFYKRLKEEGLKPEEAVIEASCQRLRAVLLTTITTIAGLTPLLFEQSFDAQFLIPMAIVLVFGLAFGTVLILLLVPGLLLSIENNKLRLERYISEGFPFFRQIRRSAK